MRGTSAGRTGARLFVLLLLLGAHLSLANPYIQIVGLLSTGSHVVAVDSATVLDCGGSFTSYRTAGWGGDTGVVDTFSYLTDSDHLPMTTILFLAQDDSAFLFSIPNIVPDTWYMIPGAPRQAEVSFSGWYVGLAGDRHPLLGRAGLTVSPSIVTGQMTVRLQPVGTGRNVVEIYDAVGNVIRSLGCTAGADGFATATWNREDDRGCLVPEGIYFCRYAGADVIATRKILVAR